MPAHTGKSYKYWKIKGGAIVNKPKGGVETSAYAFTGRLKEISEREQEYEGNKYMEIQVIMEDKEGRHCIQFHKKSWFSIGFFSRADKIDLNKELTIGASKPDDGGKVTFCWLKQGDTVLKKDPNFPKPDNVDVGGEVVKNWRDTLSSMNTAMLGVNERLKSTLSDGTVIKDDPGSPIEKGAGSGPQGPAQPEEQPPPDGDLPF